MVCLNQSHIMQQKHYHVTLLMTHVGSTRARQGGRSRVMLRPTKSGRWWTSMSGLQFRTTDGYCKTHDRWLLLNTVQKIAHPEGLYEEVDVNSRNSDPVTYKTGRGVARGTGSYHTGTTGEML